ncbi:MAG TPA: metallophosphoesterase, partial [Verrucomicrobiae bacterium]|nr:metallophosphoesterase [Verrucomicrobiae bacterium]
MFADVSKLRLTRRGFFRAAASVSAFSALDAFAMEPTWLRVRHIRLAKGKPAHRLVHLTDIHHKGDAAWLKQVIHRVNELKPDFVCFTGDLIEESVWLPEALEIIQEVKAPL